MKNEDKDLRKEIEDLEKLIQEVKQQNEEEKKKLRMNVRPQPKKVIRINLAIDYSNDLIVNVIVGFLVNFILIFSLTMGLQMAEVSSNYILVLLALIFTAFETILKRYMFQKQQKLVIYSQGIVFFLGNIVFFYLMDLVVFAKSFSFVNNLYPVLFVFLFQLIRVFIKNLYVYAVKKLSVRVIDKK